MQKTKRNFIFHINQYQKIILYPILICSIIAGVISIASLIYYYYLDEHSAIVYGMDFEYYHMLIPVILTITICAVLCITFWTYRVTNKLLGGIERILKDLDKIIEGQSHEELSARKDDVMLKEIVKRINILVKRKSS